MQNLSRALASAKRSRHLCLTSLRRTFLSESYFCYEQWDKYLMSSLMKKMGTSKAAPSHSASGSLN